MPDQTLKTTAAVREAAIVGLGAALGAAARYGLTAAVPAGVAGVAATLAVNIAGCFAMGALRPGPAAGTGFLGGFTTFSAMAVAAVQTTALGALALVALSFIGCVSAWLAGDAIASRRSAAT